MFLAAFIQKMPQLQTTQMSINGWMDKQILALFIKQDNKLSNNNKRLLLFVTRWVNQDKHYVEKKEMVANCSISGDSGLYEK
jgi:hypothetical protein